MGNYDETDVFFGSAGYIVLSGADKNSINGSLSRAFSGNIRTWIMQSESDKHIARRFNI